MVVQDDCYLGTPTDSINLCYTNWTLASIGAFIAVFVFFMALCNRRPGRSTPFLVGWFFALGVFSALAGINQKYVPAANDYFASVAADTPGQTDDLGGWRSSILGLSWAAFALALVAFVASAVDLGANKNAARPPQQFVAGGPPPGAYYQGGPPPPGYGAPPYGGYGGPPPPGYGGPPPPGYAGYGAPPPPEAGKSGAIPTYA